MIQKPENNVGETKYNDCLYFEILKAFNNDVELLPGFMGHAWKFKKYLGYDRNDKIEINDENMGILEKKLKCSFFITGDINYISDVMQIKNICLSVKNKHVTLKCNEHRIKSVGINYKPVVKIGRAHV